MIFARFAVLMGVTGLVICASGIAGAAELPKDANTTCPVMLKEKVNPDMYVEYKGQRVYVCCTKCKRRFSKDPEKYIARLKGAKADKEAKAAKGGATAPAAGKAAAVKSAAAQGGQKSL